MALDVSRVKRKTSQREGLRLHYATENLILNMSQFFVLVIQITPSTDYPVPKARWQSLPERESHSPHSFPSPPIPSSVPAVSLKDHPSC